MITPVNAVLTVLNLVLLVAVPQAAEHAPGPDSLMLEISETAVVETGFLYLHGHPVEPPYVFTIAGDSLYAELYINDYIADWVDKRPRDIETLSPFEKLVREVSQRLRQMRDAGTTTAMERTEVAAEMYRQHPECADSVRILAPGNLDVVRRDASGHPYHETFVLESPRHCDPPTAYETVRDRMTWIVRGLEQEMMVTSWRGMGGYYPALGDSGFSTWLRERPPRIQELYENPPPLEKRRR